MKRVLQETVMSILVFIGLSLYMALYAIVVISGVALTLTWHCFKVLIKNIKRLWD